MEIDSILVPERTFSSIETSSKKRAIEIAADLIARTEPACAAGEVYRGLIDREKLGPTAVGHGIAIPHCRLKNCTKTICALFRLSEGMDFGAFDDELVTLMFVLLFPGNEEADHLHTLAMLAKRIESETYLKGLKLAKDDRELFEMALWNPEEEASHSHHKGTS
ncbi:MAG: PTS sugar transporter subunit IIA [Gammaproteobacteria bacterium]|nr:PTS sugar transporter subunit IIA [Gammaproteobacteria bacterium]